MKEIFRQIKWQFLIIQRNNLIQMIIGMTVFYILVIYFLKGIGNVEKFVTLLILSDPSIIGFMFVGLLIILEKDQEVMSAFFIAPINFHFYLLSRILPLTFISLFCAWGMVLMAKGLDFNFLHFTIGALSTSFMFSLIGVFVVSHTTEVLHFILRSVPLLILMSLPFFNFFGLTDIFILDFFPVQGSLLLIANSYKTQPILFEIVFGYISIALWSTLLYVLVFRTFKNKMVGLVH